MAIKSTFKNGALVLMNPKTGDIASDSDEDALKNFSDESIDSDEFDSEYGSDNSGEMSYDEAELKPLSEIWDMDGPGSDVEEESIKLDTRQEELEEVESESSEEEESEYSSSEEDADDESDVFAGSDGETDDEGELKNVLDKLKQPKKTLEKQKKKLVSLNIKENELNVPTNGAKLSIADMMEAVNDKEAKEKTVLLKNTKEMKPLAIPLPKRIQERHERSAAYEIAKTEVSKWKEDVDRIKHAEVVKFPLVSPGEQVQRKTSAFIPSGDPMNELESKVNTVLEQSLLNDTTKEALFEQIKTAKMSKEELAKKQNELRLMRELLFREERKAKRLKKIKSKSYRRIKKKEMLKNQQLLGDVDEDAEDHDEARAEARMTLKFKNNSSKWAKDMLKHGMTKDKETRAEMEAMLEQGQKLREKIIGTVESDEDASLNDFDNEEEEEEEDIQVGKTGFMNMAFMQKAKAKDKERNQEELAKLRKLEQGLDIEEFKENSTNNAKVILNKGRRVYTPDATKAGVELTTQNREIVNEQEIDEKSNVSNKLRSKFDNKQEKLKQQQNQKQKHNESQNQSQSKKVEEQKNEEQVVDDEAVNPWLGANAAKAVKKSKKIKVVDQTSTKAEKQEHKLKKSKKKTKDSDDSGGDLINTNVTLNIKSGASAELSSDDEDQVDGFQQKDLIKEAFAGDNVVKEFEREKKRTIEEEDDQWVDSTTPGFNSWIGGGVKERKKQKKNQKKRKVEGVKSANKRTDKDLKNVIFNEKVNKKNLKYQSDGVPFPYENKEQYERSLRMPIGQEWTTRATFQKLTMPSVITKPGQVIKPLSKKAK